MTHVALQNFIYVTPYLFSSINSIRNKMCDYKNTTLVNFIWKSSEVCISCNNNWYLWYNILFYEIDYRGKIDVKRWDTGFIRLGWREGSKTIGGKDKKWKY